MKRKIERTTLIAIDTYNYGAAVKSLKKSMEQCDFEEVLFFTDIPIQIDGLKIVQIPSLKSKDDYSQFLMKEAYKYIKTDFALITQHDSWVLDSDQFDERLYDYDYCGPLWLEQDGKANGNGGFSWRAKRLMQAVGEDDFIDSYSPEDVMICRVYRSYLETKYGLKWAPDDVCEQFGFELRQPIRKTFGFHSFFHPPFRETVVVARKAALGDVVSVEPVLEYFHNKGYRVCLDTLPEFFNLFQQHYFPILHPSQLDGRVPVKRISLDMAYEVKPEQLHLKTYYEFAGIKDGVIRNPRLHLNFDPKSRQFKLFPKYALIHIDIREQKSRNIYGIDWPEVAIALKYKGYTVVQIGRGEHEIIEGAIQFNTSTEALLLMTCAGADVFLGIDSGISHICAAFNIPSIICFGSVNPDIIHPVQGNKIYIHNHQGIGVCNKKFCWHSEITTVGVDCIVDKKNPPCSQFKTIDVLKAINLLCG